MFNLYNIQSNNAIKIIENNANLTDLQFLESQIEEFLSSKSYKDMITAYDYLKGKHDILKRKRGIYNGDTFVEMNRLPNNKIVDNQYLKCVEQKTNYLFARSLTVTSEDEKLQGEINNLFNKRFLRTFKKLGENAINYGIGYLFPYLSNGQIKFKNFAPYEVLPLWADEEQTELDILIRVYQVQNYTRNNKDLITKVEIYYKDRVDYYTYDNNLILEKSEPYLLFENNRLAFDFVPVIPFKSNSLMQPLINKIKPLQDALNLIKSNFVNYMEEDPRTTWIVLKDNGGTDLQEFKKNMAELGILKIDTFEGGGGVDTLSVEVDSNNYTVVIDMLKKSIIENAKAFDVKDERMSNNPNQMNIRSMYSDIDLDSNGLEVEFQCSLEQMFDLLKIYFNILGIGEFANVKVDVKFNKDQLLNTTETIADLATSYDMLSRQTILENHPLVKDVQKELERINEEQTSLVDDGYQMEQMG